MIIQIILNLKNVTMNVSIFITGSNSKVLSGDLSTHLAGRYINIKMMPFTFSEYLELQNSQGIIKDKDEFRATIAPVWVVLNTILIFNHYSAGYYIMKNLLAAVVSILPLAASLFVGNYLYSRINQNLFLKLTYILLFISGASLLI